MKALAMLVLALCTCACATPSLQGKWVVTAAEHEGEAMPAIIGGTLAVAGDAFTIHTAGGTDYKGKLQVAANKQPAELDFFHDLGWHWVAIYKIDGETLQLNYVGASAEEPRPKQFKTSKDSEVSLLTLRREKK